MDPEIFDLRPARKTFSVIGLALTLVLVVNTVLQMLWFYLPEEGSWMVDSTLGYWFGSFLPLYVVAVPLGVLVMRKLPAQAPQEHKLKVGHFLVILIICQFLSYSGNLIGNIMSMVLSGGTAENGLMDYVSESGFIKILFMVILAPLVEEYLCRKQLIDRIRQYGEKTAVLVSGLLFALMHQNFFQFFYAFAVGAVLAYVYLRTGRLRYSVLLHSILNFFGGVVSTWILSLVNIEAMEQLDVNASEEALMALYMEILPGMLVMLAYLMFLICVAIAGFVLLIVFWKKFIWKEAEQPIPKGHGAKTVFGNVGMVVYILFCAVFFVLALL